MTSSLASDIGEALRSNTAALSIFEGLSPSNESEYLKWITSGWPNETSWDRWDRAQTSEAKREQTRKRRIAGMIEKLVQGRNGQA